MASGTYSALADITVPFVVPSVSGLDDAQLLDAHRELAEIRRRVDAAAAGVAGEVQRRSSPDLGHAGLAQRLGARTPQKLVQLVTGVSAREANALVRVGTLTAVSPWLGAVAETVGAGGVSIDAADAIRGGLGEPNDAVTAEALGAAADTLLAEARVLTPERLAVRARQLRSELDDQFVRDHEARLRDQRFLRLTAQPDGMTRISGLLDPESAAIVVGAYDAATSPRRGGPRFVDAEAKAWAERVASDERSTDQVALDAFVDLIRLGTAVDDGTIVGAAKPVVRILVTKAELDNGSGAGHIEGQSHPVSIETVKRRACSGGAIPILFDGRRPVDLGRSKRLFTRRQNELIAARDGGCIFPECDRPPSWSESHHIEEWQHGGKTNIADGVLLCRHHHLLLHNNGWQCVRRDDRYYFMPPASIDPARALVPAQCRSAAYQALVS